LLATRWVTVAAPAFIARFGAPRSPAELAGLNCLRFLQPGGRPRDFSFRDPDSGETSVVAVGGNLVLDHGGHLLDAARAGHGVAQVLDFTARPALANGEVVELLAAHAASGPDVHAVMAPERARSTNVRAVLELLSELFERVALG
jgi:DNA-binding transcriptional LysR family regulator